jgi:hypothetical protein
MFNLCWGQKVSPEFRNRLIQLCRRHEWTNDHANWLMAAMAFESGETFSPSIKNAAGSGATGLIQFMPSTAKGLGTTTADLAKMSAVDQLFYVEQYFKPYAKRIKSLPDMYMAILLPKYIGRPDESVLFSGGIAYRQNSGLDTDRDGVVTKLEAAAKVSEKFIKGYAFTELVQDV